MYIALDQQYTHAGTPSKFEIIQNKSLEYWSQYWLLHFIVEHNPSFEHVASGFYCVLREMWNQIAVRND
jgi:hypothetical protein